MLHFVMKHPAGLTYCRILERHKVRLCYSQVDTSQKSQYSIIHSLINLKERALEKKKIDPKVEKWRDKLIYSDYLQTKLLKYGYCMNRRIQNQMQRKIEAVKREKLMEGFTISIALKYLENPSKDIEINTTPPSIDMKEEPKPIYMPYAAEDSFEAAEYPEEIPIVEQESSLNENFKKIYEKYLSDLKDNKDQNKEIKNELDVRLGDDLSKVPQMWMTDYETFNDVFEEESWEAYYGTPDPKSRVSSIPCGGCGALLHCKDSEIPGYLPSELFKGQSERILKSLVCQRCHFMKHYNTSLDVKVSPDVYPKLLSVIKDKKCAVILMVDLTELPGSIWPNISTLIGRRTPIYVVGNKVDLLPRDSPKFFEHVENCLRDEVLRTGISPKNLRHISLISAKSGFGVESLINKLQNEWRYKGDVYLIGCTNVGKSSLFNALIQSDYCKVQAIDLMQRATTSPWPGTTLNLLKFPITNPLGWRLYERTMRLQAESQSQTLEENFRRHQFSLSRNIQFATLQGRIGRTFRYPTRESLREDFSVGSYTSKTQKEVGLDEDADEFKFGRWCYDTPGTIHPEQILHLLTTDELLQTLSQGIISPRSFIMHEGRTLFLAGLGRIDCLDAPSFVRFTVFSSKELPVTICKTVDADDIYQELLHSEAFVVPMNNEERLKLWPELRSKEMEITGISGIISAADVVLSSAGWVSVTPPEDHHVKLRAWTPESRGLYLRTPALLPKSVTLRGARVNHCPAYKSGRRVYMKAAHY